MHGTMHNYPLAEQCYLQALRDDDEDFSAAYYLGITYRNMGDETLAEKYLALANQLNPEP
jgi:tetratricopeptide (TPR) repeat protein